MKTLLRPSLYFILATILGIFAGGLMKEAAAATKMEKLTTSDDNDDGVATNPALMEDYPHRHVFYFGPGQTYLHGRFAKQGEDKLKNEFYYQFRAGPRAGFILNLSWHKFTRDNSQLRLGAVAPGFKFNLYRYEGLDAYVLGGLGFYQVGRKDGEQDWQRKWALGWNAGAGLNLSLNSMINYAIQGHYHYPFKVKYDEGKMNGTYWTITMLVGLAF
jgi:opacity protein-like surface antigen